MANQIMLTTNELAASFLLSGYEKTAAEIINTQKLIEDESDIESFSFLAEKGLKTRGYWNYSTENIASGLADLLYLLLSSKRKVRCIEKKHILIFHYVGQRKCITQHISGDSHIFTLGIGKDNFLPLLMEHFGMKEIEKDKFEPKAFGIKENLFNELLTIESEAVNAILSLEFDNY